MDPRLWELLRLPPGALYIQNVRLCHEGSTVIVDCTAITDENPRGQNFQINFKNCRNVQWEAMDPYNTEANVQAFGVFLGEQSHNKPAIIYTGMTEMSVLYDSV
ncbi:MAG: hypothetical protein AAGK74_13260, partial [Chloroflexota bacterium]